MFFASKKLVVPVIQSHKYNVLHTSIFLNHVMVGVGFPVAAHSMMRFLPCVMVMLSAELFGGRAILGGTAKNEIRNHRLHSNFNINESRMNDQICFK